MTRREEAVLRRDMIRIAHANPDVRTALVPIIRKHADLDDEFSDDELMSFEDDLMAGRTWGKPNPGGEPDDNNPYRSWPDSPPAGKNKSPERRNYNNWYRENVCPDKHKTNCGAPWLKK